VPSGAIPTFCADSFDLAGAWCDLPQGMLDSLVYFYYSQPFTMKTKAFLEVTDVKAILAAAEAEAVKNNWAVAITVVDDGGHMLGMLRLDGVAAIAAHISPAKAKTAALGRRESKVYEDIINGGRMSFLSAPVLEGMLEGGVPILKDGQCLGAVGVSGVKSPEDAQIARAGIAAIGL
jgi:glc operon protein GlcG